VRGQTRFMAVAMAAAALAMGSPSSPANADEFSCSAFPHTPAEDSIANDLVLVPPLRIGESAACNRPAAMVMKVRPEIEVDTLFGDRWKPAGPAEGRVTGGDYVTGPAVSTDEAHSGARTVDCDVEVRVTPPVAP
jgi:hypothetical protein